MITRLRTGHFPGHTVPVFPNTDAGTVAGNLRPTVDDPGVSPLIQVRPGGVRNMPILQRRPPMRGIGAARDARRVSRAPKRLSPDEMRGVSQEQILEVRNEGGMVLETDLLMVDRWLESPAEAAPPSSLFPERFDGTDPAGSPGRSQ